MITVADYIARFFLEKKIEYIFGYQGSAMLKILDALLDTKKIQYIQNFHEQASSFAADAYARCSDKIGAAIATSGPGAANLIGGIANAFFDSVPTLFITGQDHLNCLINKTSRQVGFQDMDIVSMVRPITKYAALIDNPQTIRFHLEKAYSCAMSERKGPVLIDVPIDIQFAMIDENNLLGFQENKTKAKVDLKLDQVSDLLKKAYQPIILVGGGVRASGACEELALFASSNKIPVVSTLNGLDAYKDTIGFSGLYGSTAANLAIKNADLILALGCRFAKQHIGKKKENYNTTAKIIHVDIDDAELNRTFMKADCSVHADLNTFLVELNKCNLDMHIENWYNQVLEWKKTYVNTTCMAHDGVEPIELIRYLVKKAPQSTIFVADVGANQMWTAQAFSNQKDYRLLNSAGFGAMGYSLPAAIGASYTSSAPVISISGDGGFQMNIQELNTLSLHKNNVKCFVFNNSVLGLMRDTQKRYYNNHFYGNNPQEFSCPNLEKLAQTYKINFLSIKNNEDFELIDAILVDNKPWIIDVKIDKDTTVLNRYDDKALQNG